MTRTLCIILFLCFGCSASQTNQSNRFSEALLAQRNGNKVAARHIYKKLAAGSLPFQGAHNNLAILEVHDGDLQKALAHLNEELSKHPNLNSAQINRVLVKLRLGESKQLLPQAKALASRLAPDKRMYSAAQLALGLVLLAENVEPELAATSLGRAIATNDPNIRAQAHFARGVLAARQEKWALAEEDFKQCISLRNDARARYNLAICMQRLGQFKSAIRQVEIARGIDGRDLRLLYLLAHLNFQEGALKKAADYVAQATSQRRKHQHLYSLLGAIHAKSQSYTAARDAFLMEIKHFPESEDAWFNLGLMNAQLNVLDKALAAFDKAAALNPANTAAVHNRNALKKALGL